MKILVTGYNGQLGFDVIKELNSRSIGCKGVDREDFDITNREETVDYICGYAPDAVVHCAAYTAVDRAEDDEDMAAAGAREEMGTTIRMGARLQRSASPHQPGAGREAPCRPCAAS